MKKTLILLLLGICSSEISFSQIHDLHFNTEGKLTGEPPAEIKEKSCISITIDRSSEEFNGLLNETFKKYVDLYESLEFSDVFFEENTNSSLQFECLHNIYLIKDKYVSSLTPENKEELYKLTNIDSYKTAPSIFCIPKLEELLNPVFEVELIQLNQQKVVLSSYSEQSKGLPNTDNIVTSFTLSKCINILEGFDQFIINVRKQNFNWVYIHTKNPNGAKINLDKKELDNIKKALTDLEVSYGIPTKEKIEIVKAEIMKRMKPGFIELSNTKSGSYDAATFISYFKEQFKGGEDEFLDLKSSLNSREKYSFKTYNWEVLISNAINNYKVKYSLFLKPEVTANEEKFKAFFKSEEGKRFSPFQEILFEHSRYNDFDALYKKALHLHTMIEDGQISEFDPLFIIEIQSANDVLKDHVKTLKTNGGTLKTFQTAILNQLWLSGPDWQNLMIIQKEGKIQTPSKVDKVKVPATPEAVTHKIKSLEARINYMNELAKNMDVKINGDTLPFPEHNLKLLESLYDELEIQQNVLKALLEKKPVSLPAEVSTAKKMMLETRDLYLNKVLFSHNKMHHIDYMSRYYMNSQPIREIDEETTLDILVHNDNSSKQYVYKRTFTPITNDVTNLEEQLVFTTTHSGNELTSEGVKQEIEKFFKNYLFIKIYMEIATFSFGGEIPKTLPRSLTPLLQTKKVEGKTSYNFENRAPAIIKYTVTNSADKKDTLLNGGYRINKLYRFRYKIGPSYSNFVQRDYTLDQTSQSYTLTESTAGLQTVFGLQTYFRKNDIRQPNTFWRQAFVFTGFNLGPDILDNVYLGFGWEFIDGMSITTGAHFGMSEKLYSRNGILAVDERAWGRPGYFVSINFDHGVFNALFRNNLRSSNNKLFNL